MDSKGSENDATRPLRRSTRQSSVKPVSFEATPRGPLKRSKKVFEKQNSTAVVNGSRNAENSSGDEVSPSKKSRLETGETEGVSGDRNEMDVQESVEAPEKSEDQEMDFEQESSQSSHMPKVFQGPQGDMNLSPRVVLGERYRLNHVEKEDDDRMKTKRVKPSTKAPEILTRPAAQMRSSVNVQGPVTKITSMAEYKKKMEAKSMSTDMPRLNHHSQSVYPPSEKSYPLRQRVKNTLPQKEAAPLKKQGRKKTAVISRCSGDSRRESKWYIWCLVLLVLLSAAILLAYKDHLVHQRTVDGAGHPPIPVRLETFAHLLSHLETRFLSQRPELWKWSKVHLEKHFQTANPTEPVSLILTAGQKAEKTLHCLAEGLASIFSLSLNASVLHIDGASKAKQQSDEVKQDIDSQLRAAFEGDKPAAVIHRFEELPPGSTLIFYRYCDHENAAYKRVFLLFTVLLPQDEVSGDLKTVEEKVQDHIKDKLVDSSKPAAFNEMDTDKFGGLWSRISHLVLPVVSEKEVEQSGCHAGIMDQLRVSQQRYTEQHHNTETP